MIPRKLNWHFFIRPILAIAASNGHVNQSLFVTQSKYFFQLRKTRKVAKNKNEKCWNFGITDRGTSSFFDGRAVMQRSIENFEFFCFRPPLYSSPGERQKGISFFGGGYQRIFRKLDPQAVKVTHPYVIGHHSRDLVSGKIWGTFINFFIYSSLWIPAKSFPDTFRIEGVTFIFRAWRKFNFHNHRDQVSWYWGKSAQAQYPSKHNPKLDSFCFSHKVITKGW